MKNFAFDRKARIVGVIALLALACSAAPAFAGSSGGTETFYNGTSLPATIKITGPANPAIVLSQEDLSFPSGNSATVFVVSAPIETAIDIKFTATLSNGAYCMYETILYYQAKVGGTDYYTVNNTAIPVPTASYTPTCYAESEGQETAVPPNGTPLIGFFDIKGP